MANRANKRRQNRASRPVAGPRGASQRSGAARGDVLIHGLRILLDCELITLSG